MKFLKTFLFTISLTFLSFGVVTLSGFCEAAPVLTPDSSSFQVIQGGGMPYYYGMQGYGEMYFMSDEFNTTFMNDVAGVMQDGQDYVVSQGYALPTNGWSSAETALANKLSGLFTQGLFDFTEMAARGYALISHNAPQWGNNAKEYFVGKVDQSTGVISDAVGNLVTKVTQQGIQNYLGYSSDLIDNGDLHVVGKSLVYSNQFQVYAQSNNTTTLSAKFNSSMPIYYFTLYDDMFLSDRYKIFACVPTSYVNNSDVGTFHWSSVPCDCEFVKSNGDIVTSNELIIAFTDTYSFTLNGVNYTCGQVRTSSSGNNLLVVSNYPLGNFTYLQDFIDYLNGHVVNPSSNTIYGASYSSISSLQALLNQLIGHYVDSDIMGQIADKISSAPIIIQYDQNNNPMPVAEPSSDLLDEIQILIDTAIDNSAIYSQLLDPLEESEPVPEPEPSSDNQGTSVPDDFPITILSPINYSIGSVFDFVSIFEPLFYIFSFSTGLLGLWFVVPFVILFLILFRLLK